MLCRTPPATDGNVRWKFFLTKRERETLVSPVSAVLIGKNAQWTPNCQNTPNGMSDYDVWHFENENFCVYVRK